MNKQALVNELETLEKGILKYFNKNESKWLDILDGDSRQYVKDYDDYKIKGYTGVTIKYLREYLFDKKYSNAMVTYVVLKIFSEGCIQSLYCCDIHHVIFESTESVHGTHYFIENHFDSESSIEDSDYYRTLIKTYNGFSNYLNK